MALDVGAWLGAKEVLNELGNPIKLSSRVTESLVEIAKDGTLSENDIPADGAVLDESSFATFAKSLKTLLADGAKAKGVNLLGVDIMRFEEYLKGRYMEDVVLKTPKKEQIMTPELRDDLDAQGMVDFDALAFLELSLYLGRPASQLERIGAAHHSPPTTMDGARTAKKHGATNLDTLVAAALESGDISKINSWMINLTQRCTNSKACAFAPLAANLINTWWSKACRLKEGRAIAWYVSEYRSTYVGRGLPVDIDTEILTLAREESSSVAVCHIWSHCEGSGGTDAVAASCGIL